MKTFFDFIKALKKQQDKLSFIAKNKRFIQNRTSDIDTILDVIECLDDSEKIDFLSLLNTNFLQNIFNDDYSLHALVSPLFRFLTGKTLLQLLSIFPELPIENFLHYVSPKQFEEIYSFCCMKFSTQQQIDKICEKLTYETAQLLKQGVFFRLENEMPTIVSELPSLEKRLVYFQEKEALLKKHIKNYRDIVALLNLLPIQHRTSFLRQFTPAKSFEFKINNNIEFNAFSYINILLNTPGHDFAYEILTTHKHNLNRKISAINFFLDALPSDTLKDAKGENQNNLRFSLIKEVQTSLEKLQEEKESIKTLIKLAPNDWKKDFYPDNSDDVDNLDTQLSSFSYLSINKKLYLIYEFKGVVLTERLPITWKRAIEALPISNFFDRPRNIPQFIAQIHLDERRLWLLDISKVAITTGKILQSVLPLLSNKDRQIYLRQLAIKIIDIQPYNDVPSLKTILEQYRRDYSKALRLTSTVKRFFPATKDNCDEISDLSMAESAFGSKKHSQK